MNFFPFVLRVNIRAQPRFKPITFFFRSRLTVQPVARVSPAAEKTDFWGSDPDRQVRALRRQRRRRQRLVRRRSEQLSGGEANRETGNLAQM